MNALLIYPKMPDTFYSMEHFIRVVGRKATYPPLGLLTLAPLLPSNWDKKLKDLNLGVLNDEDLKWADIVFLSAMNVQESSVRNIVSQCKEAGVLVVAGGPLFTHEYERFPEIDHFVLNEAEITLPLFLSDLEKGEAKSIYQTKEFSNMHATPIPAFELAEMDKYVFAIVQYSRGCPYLCDFCDVTALFGRLPRTKTSSQIIAELEALEKLTNVKLVLFADDNLIGNKKILKKDLLPALIEWRKKHNPGFFFATQVTVNLADDDELISLMIDAGFRHIFIGIETPDEKGLQNSHKTQNLKRDQLANIFKLHSLGFIIYGGFIVGLDTDTPAIFQQQIDFIQESGIPLPIVNILKAPPGTELFDRMKRENRINKDFAFSEGDTNIVPKMDEILLYEGYLKLIENIYTPQKSYERLVNFLKTYKRPKTSIKVPEKIDWKELIIVFRIFWLLGIVDSNRKYFWKMLVWPFLNNNKHKDKAFFYAVMIYQMHQTYLQIKQDVERNIKLVSQKKNESANKIVSF